MSSFATTLQAWRHRDDPDNTTQTTKTAMFISFNVFTALSLFNKYMKNSIFSYRYYKYLPDLNCSSFLMHLEIEASFMIFLVLFICFVLQSIAPHFDHGPTLQKPTI